jgi:hypothetical protein
MSIFAIAQLHPQACKSGWSPPQFAPRQRRGQRGIEGRSGYHAGNGSNSWTSLPVLAAIAKRLMIVGRPAAGSGSSLVDRGTNVSQIASISSLFRTSYQDGMSSFPLVTESTNLSCSSGRKRRRFERPPTAHIVEVFAVAAGATCGRKPQRPPQPASVRRLNQDMERARPPGKATEHPKQLRPASHDQLDTPQYGIKNPTHLWPLSSALSLSQSLAQEEQWQRSELEQH